MADAIGAALVFLAVALMILSPALLCAALGWAGISTPPQPHDATDYDSEDLEGGC